MSSSTQIKGLYTAFTRFISASFGSSTNSIKISNLNGQLYMALGSKRETPKHSATPDSLDLNTMSFIFSKK